VAFEMAQQLLARGAEVGLLAVFDTPGRSSARTWSLRRRFRAQVTLLKEIPSRQRLGHLLTRARVKSRKEWSLLTRRTLLRLGYPLPRALSNVTVINRHASREYVPRVYAGRVTLFRAREGRYGEDDPALGWAPLAAGGLDLIEVPGDHVTMLREPNTAVLAEHLGRCLDRTRD
jgi:thioesterase domain-containing protein